MSVYVAYISVYSFSIANANECAQTKSEMEEQLIERNENSIF